MPQLPPLGSLTRAPWAHPAREPPLDLAGTFTSLGAVATGAGAGFPGGRAGPRASRRLQPARSTAREGSERDHTQRPEPRAEERGNPRRAEAGALGFLPGRATPGGHRGSLEPLNPTCVDSCEPAGEVPWRPQRPKSGEWLPGQGWRRERLLRVVFPPGGNGPPPCPGVRAACQGERNPVPPGAAARAALPTPGLAAALPGAE